MEQSQVKKRDAYWILGLCFILIASCIIFDISLIWGFWTSVIFLMYMLKRKGFSKQFLISIFWEAIKECRKLYFLLLLIGATISVWLSSGVVPAMMYYGFEYMHGINFLLAAFVITSIASIFVGTAVGTISTIGIALLGIGKGFGIPYGILLGAVISGAYIADKLSPVSGLLNLILTTTKINYRQILKRMSFTFLPAFIITAIIYYFIGKGYDVSSSSGMFVQYQQAIQEGFFLSPWLMLLPIGIIILTVCGLDIILTIIFGILVGGIFSLWFQKNSILGICKAIIFGYKGSTPSEMLNKILEGGGMVSMVEVVLVIMGAVVLSTMFERSGLIDPIVGRFIEGVRSKSKLIFRTGILSGLLTILTCDQAVGIILPVKLFKEKYEELNLDRSILARTVSDTGVVIAPLIPWNINALIIQMVTGMSVTAYFPYAILCYAFPAITIIVCQMDFGKNKSQI